MPLSLFLLGPPRVEIDGVAIIFPRQKSLALLVYLAVTGEQQRRDSLSVLLWPESGDARGSLRRELSSLKSALGNDDWLDVERESVALMGDVRLDLQDFLAAAHEKDPARFAQAADLYRGDFLSGFSLADSPEFDDWQFFQAEECRRVLASVLELLITHCEEASDPEAAIPYARRLLALDNLHEPAHRTLMRLYAMAGQQAAALRQYDECVRLLDEELGIPPEDETGALYEAIRPRRLPEDDKATSSPRALTTPPSPLPRPITSFIGREEELSELTALIARPEVQLVTIVAPGGMGKSRLAIEAARRLIGEPFPDGVRYASLVGVSDASQMLSALVQLLDAPTGQGDAKAALLRFLARRRLLLVLDNFEQLADSAAILAELLQGGPQSKLLVTSRIRLNLQEEWVFPLEGLSAEDEAIRLFVERARQTQPDFDVAGEVEAAAAICREVEGMPLAIELAATWLRVMSCGEIASEIRQDVDFLSTSLRNLPEQHRSMRAVFERSWGLLTAEEQRALARLSVFHSGFTRQAAAAVAEAGLPILSALVDHSLLRHSAAGRYDIHELVRQCAAEKLDERDSSESVRDRHADYYLKLLAAHTDDIQWLRPYEAVAELFPDRENFFAGWQRAVRHHRFEAIRLAASALLVFSNHTDTSAVARSGMQVALTEVENAAELTCDQRNDLQGRLLWRLDCLDSLHRRAVAHLAQLSKAKAHLQQSNSDTREERAVVDAYLAMALGTLGRNDEGAECLDQAVAAFTALGNMSRLGWVYGLYCFLELGRGRPAAAHRWYDRSVSTWRSGGLVGGSFVGKLFLFSMEGEFEEMRKAGENALLGLPDPFRYETPTSFGRGTILLLLGEWAIFSGELDQAEAYFQEASTVLQQEGHPSQFALGWRASMATLYRLQRRWDLARGQIESLLETAREIGFKQRIVARLHELARLEHDLGHCAEAEVALAEALEIARAIDFLFFEAQNFCQMGHVAAVQGKREAGGYYRRALQIAAGQRMNPIVLDVIQGVARLRAAAGEAAQAIEWLSLAAFHPNGEWETKQKAEKALIALSTQIASDESHSIQERGRSAALELVVQDVLIWLNAQ